MSSMRNDARVMRWALTDASQLLSDACHAGRARYDHVMRRLDPLGNRPKHIYPDDHPSILVSKVPTGWWLFLRAFELDRDPSYGVDRRSWVGYYFTYPTTDDELLRMAHKAYSKYRAGIATNAVNISSPASTASDE